MVKNPAKSSVFDDAVDYPACCVSGDGDLLVLAEQLKALGHPARLKIVSRLRELSKPCCGEVCECLPLAQSTVSQHLDVLKKAGIVKVTQNGTRSQFELDEQVLATIIGALSQVIPVKLDRTTMAGGLLDE